METNAETEMTVLQWRRAVAHIAQLTIKPVNPQPSQPKKANAKKAGQR